MKFSERIKMRKKNSYQWVLYLILFELFFLLVVSGKSSRLADLFSDQMLMGTLARMGIVALAFAALFALSKFISNHCSDSLRFGWSQWDTITGICTIVVAFCMLLRLFRLPALGLGVITMPIFFFFPLLVSIIISDRLLHQKDSLYFWPIVILLTLCSCVAAVYLPYVSFPEHIDSEGGILFIGFGIVSAFITLIGNVVKKISFDRSMAELRRRDADTFKRLSSEGKRWFVRCQALHRLADEFTTGNRDAVMAALRDPDFRVRWQALRILDKLDREHAAIWLKEVGNDSNRLVQATAEEIGKRIALEQTAQG